MTCASSRPSDARRKNLNDGLSVPQVSNFFRLDTYFGNADSVYQSFQSAYEVATAGDMNDWNDSKDASLDDAYVFGKRYCRFYMEQISKHHYYNTIKYKPIQQKHMSQIQKAVNQLEIVAERMDVYEVSKIEAAEKRARGEELERDRAHQKRIEAFQTRFQEQQNANMSNDGKLIAASALDKLQRFQSPRGEGSPPKHLQRDPSGERPLGKPSTKYSMLSDDDEDEDLPLAMLPGAVPYVPMSPPSYDQAFGEMGVQPQFGFVNGMNNLLDQDTHLKHGSSAPLLSYREPTESANKHLPRKSPRKVPLETLQMQYESDYKKLVKEGKIIVSTINTYQGRVSASTNGCTVISALLVSHHLQSSTGVQDSSIVHVIDRQCGPLLKEIRSKLGLGGNALIIPSDVHDHLVDHKLLPQDKFLGVAGGNILDPEHLRAFLKLLGQAQNKGGATLFFHEHVISLIKYYDKKGNGSSYSYDLIDSLPTHNGKATRTRCNGLDALQVLVRWYASRKFSPSDCHHVDRNEWDDNLADVDPRVFQGFVWGDAPQ